MAISRGPGPSQANQETKTVKQILVSIPSSGLRGAKRSRLPSCIADGWTMLANDQDPGAPAAPPPAPHVPGLWSNRPEFPIYAALKYRLCQQLAAGARSGPMRFTARRIVGMLTGPGPDRQSIDRLFTDLYPISSHAIRERLKALNSGTILQSTGRGLRNAVTYTWREPIPPGALRSFHEIQRRVGDEVHLAFDAYRLAEAFGVRDFSVRDYLRHFVARREVFARQRATSASRVDPAFIRFLMHRLASLQSRHLVVAVGPQTFRLSAAGEELAHWFELFAYSVDLAPG